MRHTLIVSIHGVKAYLKENYAYDFFTKIKQNLSDRIIPFIHFHAFEWDSIVNKKEEQTYKMMCHLGNWKTKKIRKLICDFWCDTLWYGNTKRLSESGDVYFDIHKKLNNEIEVLIKKLGNDSNLILIGHSWGSQIAFDYSWSEGYTVDGMVTMGSPILYGSGRFHNWGELPQIPFNFWLNFVVPFDPIACDFKNHPNEKFRQSIHDIILNTWNPFIRFFSLKAHTSYWKNSIVHKEIAKSINNLYI